MTITITNIETATKRYADNRDLLILRVQELNDELEAVKRKFIDGIKTAAADTAAAREELAVLVDEGRHLFTKPKTLIISNIRVGLKKGTGKTIIEDDETTIKLLHKHVAAKELMKYIEIVEKIRKKNLADLDAATLKKCGVVIEDTGDVVFIKPADSEIDKLVNAILKEGEPAELEDAA